MHQCTSVQCTVCPHTCPQATHISCYVRGVRFAFCFMYHLIDLSADLLRFLFPSPINQLPIARSLFLKKGAPNFLCIIWGGGGQFSCTLFTLFIVAVRRCLPRPSADCISSELQRIVVFRFASLCSLHRRIQFFVSILCFRNPYFLNMPPNNPYLAIIFSKFVQQGRSVSAPWLQGFVFPGFFFIGPPRPNHPMLQLL